MLDRDYVVVKIDQVREVLDRQGWGRDSYVSNYTRYMESPVCLMGAIKMVTTGRPWAYNDHTRRVMLAVAKHVPEGRLIDDWNDDPDTQLTDVYRVLDAARQENAR